MSERLSSEEEDGSHVIVKKGNQQMSSTQKSPSLGCFARSIFIGLCCLFLLLFLFGLPFIVAGIYVSVQFSHLAQNGVQTQATVVDVQPEQCGKNASAAYKYTLQFTNRTGQRQTETLDCMHTNASPGTSISIVYLPDDPTIIALPSDVGNLPAGTVAVSIFFVVVDLLMLACFIYWLKNGKKFVASSARRKKPAVSRQAGRFSGDAGAPIVADGLSSSTIPPDLSHYWTQEQPPSPTVSPPQSEPEPGYVDFFQPAEPSLFDAQNEQTESP